MNSRIILTTKLLRVLSIFVRDRFLSINKGLMAQIKMGASIEDLCHDQNNEAL